MLFYIAAVVQVLSVYDAHKPKQIYRREKHGSNSENQNQAESL